MKNLIFDIQRFADIYNSTDNTIITGTAYNDNIYNIGSNVEINALSGNDTITTGEYSNASHVSINGGAGNDLIKNEVGSGLTITGGTGDDTIKAWYGSRSGWWYDEDPTAHVYQYNEGDGNDIIFGLTSEDTLMIGGASTTVKNGDDTVIQVGNGSITLRDTVIANSKVNDTILTGNSDSETIVNRGDNVTINGSDGDDRIINYTGKNVVIYANAGDDALTNYDDNVTISGGDGDDDIYNSGDNVTIYGGDGDDDIDDSGDNGIYVYESGNDTLNSYSSSHLRFAATYTGWTLENGSWLSDLVLNAAEGSLRVYHARSRVFEIENGNGALMAYAYFAESYSGILDGRSYAGFEVIQGSDYLSNQIYAGAYGSSLYGGTGGNDELYGNVGVDNFVYKYGDGNDTLFNAGAEDVVNLNSISLGQLAGAQVTDGGVIAVFNDGGTLAINGQAGTFILGGQSYGADYQSKTFYNK